LTIVEKKGDLFPLFLCPLLTALNWHPAARGTGDITHNIEGIDEEFQEFWGERPGRQIATICRMIIGLGVVGSLVGQEPNNSVYLAPWVSNSH